MSPHSRFRSPTLEGRLASSTFASIVSIAADGIITVDAEQRIIFFNEGAERMFGWRADEVMGEPITLLIPDRFRGAHEGHVRHFGHGPHSARRMGERSEISGLRRNGEEFPAEASISRVANEGEMVYTVVIRDVTERKRTSDRLRFLAEAGETLAGLQELADVETTVAQLPVPLLAEACLVEIVTDGGLLAAAAHDDEGMRDALGRLRHGARSSDDEAHPATRARVEVRVIEQLLDPDAPPAWLPADLARKLGRTRLLAVPLVARGMPLGAMLLFRPRAWDDAELVLAADYARRAALSLDGARLLEQVRRALRVRDEVTGIVSHDLRNPVQAVKMLAGAIAASAAQVPEQVLEHASVIRQAAEQMDRLIQDLLDAARLEAGRLGVAPAVEDPTTLIELSLDAMRPLAHARGQVITLDIPEALPAVFADAGRVGQVLSNLVGNAVKFTPEGGRIDVNATWESGEVVVRVMDSGPGVPLEARERVFDRWVQLRGASSAGAGLGLPIARGIVEAHGGRIWHEPAEGGGSVFAFTLPMATED